MSENPNPDSTNAPPAPSRRRELAAVLLVQGSLALLFLSPALFTGRYFSPSDLLFDLQPWHEQAPPGWTQASNLGQFDNSFVFEPWLRYTAEALHSGRLPLWNAENFLGAPFIGNMQSAVFYPINWLYFLWPSGSMYAVRAWLQLLLAALGMYLLARESIGVSRIAAHLAAITFTYGAFVIIWLFWPLTSVAIWLPWLWWATDRLIARPSARGMAGLAVLAAVSIVAGHPETSFLVALFSGAFALFTAWRTVPTQPQKLVGRLGLWGAAYGLGVMIASVQLLPFAEYLAQSAVLVWRNNPTRAPAWVPLAHAWTAISPDLFGNPRQHNEWDVGIGYIEGSIYSGLLPLILAPLACWSRPRGQRAIAWFLLGLIGIVCAVIYHFPVAYQLITALPVFNIAANRRLVLVLPLALGLLVALGFDTLREQGASRRMMLTGGATLLAVLGGGIVLPWLGAQALFQVPTTPPGPDAAWQAALVRAAGMWALIAALLGLTVVLLRRERGWTHPALWLAFPALLFADLWQVRGDYNPTVAPTEHFPPTHVSQFLQQQPPQTRFTGTGVIFPPNTNLWYNLNDLRGYDAVEPALYRDLALQIEPLMRHRAGGMYGVFGGCGRR